ncbi:MAG: EscU/YscU/HrcU family type III secretion system export apparatus switch protein [Alphaproteobacteria bacterium]|nr:EscU/YscU/HrcU family type III secretion system export apparatus switch protein [Alphaproteobacteria bacterium]
MADSGNTTNGDDKAPRKAVALGHAPEADQRPKVLAAGHGAVAEQILQIAFANDIKVREDADLVEVLSSVDIESEIPLEALAAVAEILAYVYRANNSTNPPPDYGCASEDAAL